MRILPAGVVVLLAVVSYSALAQNLQIQAVPPQGAVVGQDYALPLTATGGSGPYTWKLVSGTLPPGLKLQAHSGKLLGVPTTVGNYQFTVAVLDSSVPQLQITDNLAVQVIEGLSVAWQDEPKAQGGKISGSAVVTNQSGDEFSLTVIIVAVNEIGRATALGYQHFRLAPGASSQVIPFGSSPGMGTYYVRIDAVAHRPGKKHVFHASKQTSPTLKVSDLSGLTRGNRKKPLV